MSEKIVQFPRAERVSGMVTTFDRDTLDALANETQHLYLLDQARDQLEANFPDGMAIFDLIRNVAYAGYDCGELDQRCEDADHGCGYRRAPTDDEADAAWRKFNGSLWALAERIIQIKDQR